MKTQHLLLLALAGVGFWIYKKKSATPLLPPVPDATATDLKTDFTVDQNRFNNFSQQG